MPRRFAVYARGRNSIERAETSKFSAPVSELSVERSWGHNRYAAGPGLVRARCCNHQRSRNRRSEGAHGENWPEGLSERGHADHCREVGLAITFQLKFRANVETPLRIAEQNSRAPQTSSPRSSKDRAGNGEKKMLYPCKFADDFRDWDVGFSKRSPLSSFKRMHCLAGRPGILTPATKI